MKKYIYQVFNKYFSAYKNNVKIGIESLIRASETEILLVCLTEMNRVMDILSGQLTSKLSIPQMNKFPSTKEFNAFLNDTDVDLDKLFSTSSIIVNDTQNVINYNITERESIAKFLSTVQSNVYSAYVMSQKGINGQIIIREDFNDEDSANTGSPETSNVIVNTKLKRLTMKPTQADIKDNSTVNTSFIDCFHYNEIDQTFNAYPNFQDLSPGSFWNIRNNNPLHFTAKKDKVQYKKAIVKSIGNSSLDYISSCQFESVITSDVNSTLHFDIEKEFSEEKNLPLSAIYIDRPISINSKYITTNTDLPVAEVKLLIPFKNAKLSTGCEIIVNPNDSNHFPILHSDKSYVKAFVNINGVLTSQKVGLTSMTNSTMDTSGSEQIYSILFNQAIIPDILELILSYDNGWADIEYMMTHWFAETTANVEIDAQLEGSPITTTTISYKRAVHILIDSNSNVVYERNKVEELFYAQGVK